MNSSQTEIEKALVDVRKAYRILHDYQRTALDSAKYIGTQLGLDYRGGYPLFSNGSPGEARGKLDNCAWDWLNLVFYDFHFTRKCGEKELHFLIRLFSDTGYFISNDPSAEKTDVSSFAPVEGSGTMVGFFFYNQWKPELDAFLNARNDVQRFLETGNDLPAAFSEAQVIGKCCSFSRISNETSADAVIAELVQLAKAHGFSIERIIKAG